MNKGLAYQKWGSIKKGLRFVGLGGEGIVEGGEFTGLQLTVLPTSSQFDA